MKNGYASYHGEIMKRLMMLTYIFPFVRGECIYAIKHTLASD